MAPQPGMLRCTSPLWWHEELALGKWWASQKGLEGLSMHRFNPAHLVPCGGAEIILLPPSPGKESSHWVPSQQETPCPNTRTFTAEQNKTSVLYSCPGFQSLLWQHQQTKTQQRVTSDKCPAQTERVREERIERE